MGLSVGNLVVKTLFVSFFCVYCGKKLSELQVSKAHSLSRTVIPCRAYTMENTKMIKPVYLRNRDIQTDKSNPISDYVLACAVGTVVSDIKCIQRDRDLWRIYVESRESRNLLISEGFELQNKTVAVFDNNSFSAGTENPSEDVVRITVRGIPLSVDDTCIKNMLEKLGAILTSDIKYEKIRNPNTFKMTEILNGNRFVYMKPMENGKFLPKSSECAGLKCSIFQKGQPTTKRSLLCTNCWGDDHLRFNCEYETCCKVCKKPGHSPGDKACSKYDPSPKDIIAFSGKDDVLSNFYPCDVKIFGISHASAEHAFQYSKAMRSGDLVRASSVRNATTALEAKRIGAQVTVPYHWIQQRDDIMRQVLEAKFDQVIEFKDKISATGSSTLLVEAAFDDYWGSGLDKKGTMYTDMKAWPGKNTMGQILTDIARTRRPIQRKQSVRNQHKNRS